MCTHAKWVPVQFYLGYCWDVKPQSRTGSTWWRNESPWVYQMTFRPCIGEALLRCWTWWSSLPSVRVCECVSVWVCECVSAWVCVSVRGDSVGEGSCNGTCMLNQRHTNSSHLHTQTHGHTDRHTQTTQVLRTTQLQIPIPGAVPLGPVGWWVWTLHIVGDHHIVSHHRNC